MRSVLLLILSTLLLASCTTVNVHPDEGSDATTTSSAETTTQGAAADDEEDEDDDPFKPWDETLKDAQKIDGFLPLHKKDDGTLYAEIPAERMEHPFGLTLHISQGVGVFNLHDGLPLSDTRLMQFRRVDHKVHLVHRNVRFRADEGPMRTSLTDNTAHSTVEVFDIVSRNDSTGHLLVEMSDFLVSDYPEIGDRLKLYFGGAPATFQKNKSYVEQAQGFPENTEIDVSLTYQGSSAPLIGGEAVPDYRAVPVGVRYSLFALPESKMQRRPADDRVGYFTDAVKDFSRDQAADPYMRYVQRWRLAPSDTAAYRRGELVEPAEPIVYYVDRTVPPEYREYVKQGIEAWNEAYRAAGYKNAVVAKTAPNDSTWSAEDIRYSTVRWTAAHQMGYAIGPSQTDPRTGEILNADILISSSFVSGWQQTYSQLTPNERSVGGAAAHLPVRPRTPEALRKMLSPDLARRACWAERGMAQQIGLQRTLLLARGVIDPGAPMPEDYLGAAIKDLVMHEVGHTLGLRHNFKASSGIPTDQLHDEEYTSEYSVSLSVMDYAPVNIALDEEEQGHYWNPGVGSYDEWAIKYGYMPIADQSRQPSGSLTRDAPLADTMTAAKAGLEKIAAESSDPMHRYGTDEDNWLGGYAVDPLTNAWELGADPKAFAEARTALVQKIMPKLDDRLVDEGERYYPLRRATTALIMERYRSLLPVTKTVGGSFVARDHKGTPDARPPLQPVSVQEQREAVQLLIDGAFAPEAFQFDAERLNKLAPNRHAHWGSSPSFPVDYPVHEYVDMVQTNLLRELLHPARLQRMIDTQVRTAGSTYHPGALFRDLTGAIWTEIDAEAPRRTSINSFRRNLQRAYIDVLIELMMGKTNWVTITLAGADQMEAPEDVRSMARLELADLSTRIAQVLEGNGLDRDTRAHLSETQARIDRALEASLDVSP